MMAGHVLPDDAYEMVSNNGRCALSLAPVRFQAGDPADFVVIDACSIRGAIASAPRSGRLAVPSDRQTTIHWRKPT